MNLNYYSDEHVVIRSMVKEDVQRFYDAFSLQGYHKPTEIFEHYLLQQRKQQCLVFVAEVDRQLAGYVTLWPKAKQGPFASLQLPEVVDLNVLEKFRKQGIGQKLMDEVEKQAKRFSSTITLGVGLHLGYGNAQKMYIQRGYQFDGTGVWYQGKQLEPYEVCQNDDDLLLYLIKHL